MGIPHEHWRQTIANYELFAAGPYGGYLPPMMDFVRRLASTSLAARLSPHTSHESLVISLLNTNPHDFHRPSVDVTLSPSTGKFWITFADSRTHVCSAPALPEVFLE